MRVLSSARGKQCLLELSGVLDYASAPYVRFVYDIPAPFKTSRGEVKTFFKHAIRDLLPHEIIYRPKQGFRTPTPELFRGRFGDWARPRLLEVAAEGVVRVLVEVERGRLAFQADVDHSLHGARFLRCR